jgi:hypothetical protein
MIVKTRAGMCGVSYSSLAMLIGCQQTREQQTTAVFLSAEFKVCACVLCLIDTLSTKFKIVSPYFTLLTKNLFSKK